MPLLTLHCKQYIVACNVFSVRLTFYFSLPFICLILFWFYILFYLFSSMVVLVYAEFHYCSKIHWMTKMAPLNNDDDNDSISLRWYEQTLTTNLTHLAHCRLCCYNSNYVCTVCALTLRSYWLINTAMLCVEHNFIYPLYIIIIFILRPLLPFTQSKQTRFAHFSPSFFQFNFRQTFFEFVLSGFSPSQHTHTRMQCKRQDKPHHNTKLCTILIWWISLKRRLLHSHQATKHCSVPSCKQDVYFFYLHAINWTTDSTEPTHTLQFLACTKNEASSEPHFSSGSWIFNWLINWNPSTSRYNNQFSIYVHVFGRPFISSTRSSNHWNYSRPFYSPAIQL